MLDQRAVGESVRFAGGFAHLHALSMCLKHDSFHSLDIYQYHDLKEARWLSSAPDGYIG